MHEAELDLLLCIYICSSFHHCDGAATLYSKMASRKRHVRVAEQWPGSGHLLHHASYRSLRCMVAGLPSSRSGLLDIPRVSQLVHRLQMMLLPCRTPALHVDSSERLNALRNTQALLASFDRSNTPCGRCIVDVDATN